MFLLNRHLTELLSWNITNCCYNMILIQKLDFERCPNWQKSMSLQTISRKCLLNLQLRYIIFIIVIFYREMDSKQTIIIEILNFWNLTWHPNISPLRLKIERAVVKIVKNAKPYTGRVIFENTITKHYQTFKQIFKVIFFLCSFSAIQLQMAWNFTGCTSQVERFRSNNKIHSNFECSVWSPEWSCAKRRNHNEFKQRQTEGNINICL